jgi:hypothetical protein
LDELLSALKAILPRLKVRVVPDAVLPNKVDAQAFPRRSLVKIRRGIQDGLLRGDGGARWTLAHEMGHVILQHPRRPYRTRNETVKKKRDGISEREANIFAAELLSPRHLAQKHRTIDDLRAAFQISSNAARIRFQELEDDKRRAASTFPQLCKAAQELTARTTYLSELEDVAAATFTVASTTIADSNKQSEITVQALKSNLLGASILIAVASRLLVDAYESFHRTTASHKYKKAAAVAATILFIRPIRGNEATPEITKKIQVLNQQCALKVAARTLNIALEAIDGVYLRGADHSGVLTYESYYLRPLLEMGENLLAATSKIPLFGKFPIYETYNGQNDFACWDEIHSLEEIMDILLLLDAARTQRV